MAYNEKIADRISEIISLTHKKVEEKKMFAVRSLPKNLPRLLQRRNEKC